MARIRTGSTAKFGREVGFLLCGGNGYVLEHSTREYVPINNVYFTFYKLFIYERFGHLGRGNWVPNCVGKKVKAKFPD